MILKLIDGEKRTHWLECTSVTYLGSAGNGYSTARGEGSDLVNYDRLGVDDYPERMFFAIYPPDGDKVDISVHAHQAWLLNDRGEQVQNLRCLAKPVLRTELAEVA